MKKLLCAALVVAIAATNCFGAGDGISRNNPGNIVKTGVLWEGQVKGKGRFAHFKDAHFGLRALGIVLIRYQQYHNIKTVEKLVARFAPAHENDVSSYENFVARHLGLYTKSPLLNLSTKVRNTMFMNNVEKMSRTSRTNPVSQGRQLRIERRKKDKEAGQRRHKMHREIKSLRAAQEEFIFAS